MENPLQEIPDVNDIMAKTGGVSVIVAGGTVAITSQLGGPPGWVGLGLCALGVASLGGIDWSIRGVSRFLLAVVALWMGALGATTAGEYGEHRLRAKPANAAEVAVPPAERMAVQRWVVMKDEAPPTPEPIIEPWLPRP